jgi:hypothetical protein
LGIVEIKPVLLFVPITFLRVEFKFHSIDIIPKLYQ